MLSATGGALRKSLDEDVGPGREWKGNVAHRKEVGGVIFQKTDRQEAELRLLEKSEGEMGGSPEIVNGSLKVRYWRNGFFGEEKRKQSWSRATGGTVSFTDLEKTKEGGGHFGKREQTSSAGVKLLHFSLRRPKSSKAGG